MDFWTFFSIFAWPIIALFLAGIAAPLTGAFLYARGSSLYGITLPQVAACGVALGFALSPLLHGHDHADDSGFHEPSRALLLACAALLVIFTLIWLEYQNQRHPQSTVARVASTFAVASGLAVLAGEASPHGGIHVNALLTGETLSAGPLDALLLGIVAVLVLAALLFYGPALTLAGHDPEFAKVGGHGPRRANLLLHALTGMVVIIGSWSLGALPMFALLVLPPLAAVRGAPSMARYLISVLLLGIFSAMASVLVAFAWDLPMDASTVLGCLGAASCRRALLWMRPMRS